MKDVPDGTIADTVKEAMDRAAGFCDNPVDQFKWAEFALYGQTRPLALLEQQRIAWLLKNAASILLRLETAPVRQGHPADELTPNTDEEVSA